MRLFDTHCHLADDAFDEDLAAVIDRMGESGVKAALVVADPCDETPNQAKVFEIVDRYPFLYGAIGCHPHNASRYDDAAEQVILNYLKREKCLLWGEIGLDYHYDLSPRDVQRSVFERQLRLAHEQGKTVQLHIREAHEDSLEILNRLKSEGKLPKGIVHCFTGDWETAQKYLALDYYISFSGAMTFKNGTAIADAATKVPEERLLVETDAPYMAPVPLRGKRNEPAFVSHTFAKLAALREKSPDALAERLWANSLTALGIE